MNIAFKMKAKILVRVTGLEPACLSAPEPNGSVTLVGDFFKINHWFVFVDKVILQVLFV